MRAFEREWEQVRNQVYLVALLPCVLVSSKNGSEGRNLSSTFCHAFIFHSCIVHSCEPCNLQFHPH